MNTQYTIFKKKRKSSLIILNLRLWGFFQGTQELVRNNRGKRAISVCATEVLLYSFLSFLIWLSKIRHLAVRIHINIIELFEIKILFSLPYSHKQ